MTELVAIRPLTYGTRRMRPGESFVAQDSHARLLVAIGRARVATVEPAPKKEVAVLLAAPEEKPKRKRAYKRRDMRAED